MFPLRVGEEWTYTATNGFTERVQTIRVTRRIPVATRKGYELDGPMGIMRIGWVGATLYGEMLPNTRVYPPVPLLLANNPKGTALWAGSLETMGRIFPAHAFLSQQADTVDLGTKRYDTIKTTLSLKYNSQDVELETWYAKGIGPIQQDQRTNGRLDDHVLLLEAPH